MSPDRESHNPSSADPKNPTLDDKDPAVLPDEVTQDIGGVQGTEIDNEDAQPASSVPVGSPAAQPAPDAGEIEWAGQLVKKPPTPIG